MDKIKSFITNFSLDNPNDQLIALFGLIVVVYLTTVLLLGKKWGKNIYLDAILAGALGAGAALLETAEQITNAAYGVAGFVFFAIIIWAVKKSNKKSSSTPAS